MFTISSSVVYAGTFVTTFAQLLANWMRPQLNVSHINEELFAT